MVLCLVFVQLQAINKIWRSCRLSWWARKGLVEEKWKKLEYELEKKWRKRMQLLYIFFLEIQLRHSCNCSSCVSIVVLLDTPTSISQLQHNWILFAWYVSNVNCNLGDIHFLEKNMKARFQNMRCKKKKSIGIKSTKKQCTKLKEHIYLKIKTLGIL